MTPTELRQSLFNGDEAWIKTSEKKPELYSNVEFSEDGISVGGTMDFTDKRRCMLAGVAGGYGYFSKPGFATDINSDTDTGLICDDPEYWRYYNY